MNTPPWGIQARWAVASAALSGVATVAALACLLAAPACLGQATPPDGRNIYPGAGQILHPTPPGSGLPPGDGRRIFPGANVLTGPQPRPYPGYGYFQPFMVYYVDGVGCYVPWYYSSYNPMTYGYYGPTYSVTYGYPQGNPYGQAGIAAPPPQQYTPPPVPTNQVPATNPSATPERGDTAAAGPGDDSDGYYLNRKPAPAERDTGLKLAIHDIESAFTTRDVAPLQKHLDVAQRLTVVTAGRDRQMLEAPLYLQMTRDALSTIHTVRYTLDHVEPGSNGTWMVYGTHVLRTESGTEKTFNVGYVLKKVSDKSGDRWVITEVSADPAK